MSNELRSEIERRQKARSFDAAIISASSLAPYLRTPAMSGVPAFVDVVDVDSQKWFDFARAVRGPKRWLYRFEGHRLRKVERDLPNWAHTITLVSDAETRAFDEIAGRSCAVTATNGVDLEYFSCRSGRGFARPDGNRVRRLESPSNPDCDAPSGLVAKPSRPDLQPIAFVGALDYLPNIDAAAWFVREVWPQIRKTHPAAAFRVIGRNPTREATSLDGVAGVEVVGSVPDVRPHLAEASVVVVPMRLGRGLQNKVLEALAMGKATVVSPPALAALKAVPGRDLMKAESPREWIDAVTGLLNDESKSGTLGANGRRFVEQHHDWEQCLRPLTDRIRALDPAECVA